MTNLDFSGLFGGGGFALDSSKFNFDAYKAPEPKKEAVVDPVDVVSDKSPTPDVEVLEGAGIVAITKPDPITQAIEALKGKDLSDDFNVNSVAPTPVAIQPVAPVIPTPAPVAPQPVVKQPPKTPVAPTVVPIKEEIGNVIRDGVKALAPTSTVVPIKEEVSESVTDFLSALAPDPIEQAIQTVKPLTTPSLGGAMDFSGLDLSTPQPEKAEKAEVTYDPIEAAMLNEDEEKDYYQSILSSSAPDLEFSAINPSASKDETGRPQINSDILNYFVGQEEARRGLQDLRPAAQGEEDNEREEIEAANLGQELVDKYNIPTSFNIDENYHWVLNPETMGYTKQLKSSTSADVALMIGATVASAGLGSAISGSSAVTSLSAGNAAVANAIGQGMANGLTTAMQGGDTKDILVQGTIGALQGGAEGLNEMTATARDAATVIGASQEVIKKATTLGAQAEVMNNVVNGINLVQAIDEKDPLKAIESALLLTDNESLSTLVKDSVVGNVDSDFVINNSDVITSGIIGAGEAIIKGEDAKGVVTSAANNVIKESILTTENVTNFLTENTDSEGFVADNMDTIVKGIIKGGNEALDGGNREDIALETIKPIVKETVKDLVKDIGSGDSSFDGLDFIEDAYHEHIEDPLEKFWQEIEPAREIIEETVGAGVEYVKAEVVQPVLDTVDTIIKEVEPTVDEVVKTVRETGREAEEVYDDAEDYVKQRLREFDENVLQPVVNPIKEELANFDDEKLQPIKEDIEKVIKDVDQALSDANKYTREELAEFDKNTLQPIKNDLEKLIEGMSTDLGGMGDMLSGLWDAITGVGEGLAATQERVSRPSADDSPLVKMRTQYGEQYEFEDLRNNPLLNNEFLS